MLTPASSVGPGRSFASLLVAEINLDPAKLNQTFQDNLSYNVLSQLDGPHRRVRPRRKSREITAVFRTAPLQPLVIQQAGFFDLFRDPSFAEFHVRHVKLSACRPFQYSCLLGLNRRPDEKYRVYTGAAYLTPWHEAIA
ncbi:hypothetical protein ABHI18_011874 [Aspergillus niger]